MASPANPPDKLGDVKLARARDNGDRGTVLRAEHTVIVRAD
jgi:hypothetical protein